MKKYNEKIIEASQKLSQDTLRKSADTVKKLTNPSSKATHVGSVIGTIVGVGLLCGGLVGTVLGKSIIGVSSFTAGAAAIVSNIINLRKKK